MSMKRRELQLQVSMALQDYADDVVDALKKVTEEVAIEAKDEVKKHAPVGKRKGKYKRSISVKTTYDSLTEIRKTIYSKEAGLTHLLEHGHRIVNKKDGVGRAKAFPHWKYGQEYIDKHFKKRCESEIKRLGGK